MLHEYDARARKLIAADGMDTLADLVWRAVDDGAADDLLEEILGALREHPDGARRWLLARREAADPGSDAWQVAELLLAAYLPEPPDERPACERRSGFEGEGSPQLHWPLERWIEVAEAELEAGRELPSAFVTAIRRSALEAGRPGPVTEFAARLTEPPLNSGE
jgi:hypothetical protein